MSPLAPLSPDYAALRDFMREKFGITDDQATEVAYWLESEYDCESTAELRDAYFKSVMNQQSIDSSDPDGIQDLQPPAWKAALN
jgi:hypothetical protein